MGTAIPSRSDVAIERTWNYESVFPSVEAWEGGMRDVEQAVPEITAFRGRLAEGPNALLDWLRTSDRIQRLLGKVMVYALLRYTSDMTDQSGKARYDQVGTLIATVGG